MGVLEKEEAMYLATGIDTTGLREGKREIVEILKSMLKETSSVDVFSGIELAAATAFTRAAANTYGFAQAFERDMQAVAAIAPEIGAGLSDYETRVVDLTREIPVAADDCARALYRIVSAGYDGGEAMRVLELAAREAVVGATGVADAFTRIMDSGIDLSVWETGFSSVDYSQVVSGMDAQLQLLQNNIMAVTRKMGTQVARQVSEVATRLGDALSDGRVEKSFRSLDALVTLASGALADYREEVRETAGEITAEGAALEIANGIRAAYHEIVENGIVQRELELQQQQAYLAGLGEAQAAEGQASQAKMQLLGQLEALAGVEAKEYGKSQAMQENRQHELALKEELLSSAREAVTARQEEYEAANRGNDVAKMEIAYTRMLKAAELEEAAAVEVNAAKQRMKNSQVGAGTALKRGETAATLTNTVATNAESMANAGDTLATGVLTKAKQRLTIVTTTLSRAMAANPIGMVLSVVSLAITAFSAFGKKTEDSATAMDKLNESLDKQRDRASGLVGALYDQNESDLKRVEALRELQRLYPEVWGKVDLANLSEQDRNKLIREGNELLEVKRERELAAAVAAGKAKVAILEKAAATPIEVYHPEGGMMQLPNAPAIKAYEEEKKNLGEIEVQLKRVRDLKVEVANEKMTKEEKLATYNEELRTLRQELSNISLEKQRLETGTKENPFMQVANGLRMNYLQGEEEAKGQQVQAIEGKKADLNKPKPLTKEQLEERGRIKNDIEKTTAALDLKYQKEADAKALAGMSEGRMKRIAQVNQEHDERKRMLEQEKRELEAKYKELGKAMPAAEEQKFEGRLGANEKERTANKAKIEEQNKEEIETHRRNLTRPQTEEGQRRDGVKERYDQERAWVDNQVENGMSKEDGETYKDAIKLVEQKEQHARLLAELNSFETQKKAIEDEWKAKRETAGTDRDLIKQLDAQKEKAVGALKAQDVMQSDEWTSLFEDLDELTISQIDKLMGDIQTKMSEDGVEIDPVNMKVITAKLGEAKQRVAELNPFRAMGASMQEMFSKQADGAGDASDEIGNRWKNLGKSSKGCFDFVNDAVNSCEVLSEILGESGQQSMAMIQGVAMAGVAMSSAIKKAETGSIVLTAISAALMIVNSLFAIFNKDKKQEKKIQRLQGEVEGLERAYNKLGTAIENTYSDNVYNLMNDQNENLLQQQELIRQQIEAEKKKKKTDKGKVKDWENEIEDINQKLEDNKRKQIEMLAGTDVQSAIDEFADALMGAYAKGEDGVKALGDTTKKVMANAVKEALKKKFLGDSIKDAVNFLGESMTDGKLSEGEQRDFQNKVADAGKNYMAAVSAAGDLLKDSIDGSGEGVTGQLQAAMTEGTASELVGLWNMTAVDTRALRDMTMEQVQIGRMMDLNVREVLNQQYLIEMNTRLTADNTGLTVTQLATGFTQLDTRLMAIEVNTKGYTGRGK